MKNYMKMLTIGILVAVMLSTSMAGCLSNVSNPLAPASKVMDYSNNYITWTKAHIAPGDKVTSSNVQANGTDAAQVTIIIQSSKQTTTESLNVKEFSSATDASAFYNSQSFGMIPSTDNSNGTVAGNPYALTMGHNAVTNREAAKVGTFSFVQVTGSIVAQQDEFIVWGDISAMVGGTSSTASATPTPKAVATPVAATPATKHNLGYTVVIHGQCVPAGCMMTDSYMGSYEQAFAGNSRVTYSTTMINSTSPADVFVEVTVVQTGQVTHFSATPDQRGNVIAFVNTELAATG